MSVLEGVDMAQLTPSLDAILAELDKIIDTKLDKRLGEFEQRLLAQFRPNDRQAPPEELIEDIPEIKPEIKPNYQAVRDRILKSLTTGRGVRIVGQKLRTIRVWRISRKVQNLDN